MAVTGATGHIGEALLPALAATDCERVQASYRGAAAPPDAGVAWVRTDLTDPKDARAWCRGADVVIHLAGAAAVPQGPDGFAAAFQSNVGLTSHVAAAAAAEGVPRFVQVSSAGVYGDGHAGRVPETTPVAPVGAYAASKLAAEEVVRAAAWRGAFEARVARVANGYGPGASDATVLGRMVAQIARGEDVRVKDGAPVRDFIHFDDIAGALVAAAAAPSSGRSWVVNVGTGISTRVAEAAALVADAAERFGSRRPSVHVEAAGGGRASSLVVDATRLQEATGWRPRTELAVGLEAWVASAVRKV